MLTDQEFEKIYLALARWAKSRPEPDEPMLGFTDVEHLLTPNQIVSEVARRSDAGMAVLEMLEHGVRREGLEKVVARLER